MKKIVALVLTLVLALSLATVAFAGTTTYLASKVLGGTVYAKSTDYYTLSLEKVKDADAEKKTVDVYQVFYNFGNDKKVPFPAAYVLATEDDADVVFVSGKDVTYLSNALLANYTGEATAIKTFDLDDAGDAVCGDYVVADGVTLYDYNGDVLKATHTINWGDNGLNLGAWMSDIKACKAIALVDGKLVTLTTAVKGSLVSEKKSTSKKVEYSLAAGGADYAVVEHSKVVDYTVTAGTLDVKGVYCETCGAKFDFVVGSEKAALKAFGAENYAKFDTTGDAALAAALGDDFLWIKTAELEGSAADAEKDVKSATTFDAGVALYAGMALMSVAGSAVVIGKKKEF